MCGGPGYEKRPIAKPSSVDMNPIEAQLPAYQRFNVDRVAKDLKGNPFSTLLVRENKRKIENNRRVGEKLPNE